MPVVTELVIDAAGATRGATEYARAMDSAQSAAQRGLGAMSDMATRAKDSIASLGSAASSIVPSFGTMAIGVAAATAAFVAGFEAVKTFSAGLAEMGLSAKRANLDVELFQRLRFAASVGGVSNTDFASGAEKLAMNLSEAKREENDMSKLLDANNIKWKDGNKLLMDTNGLLNAARDLIHRAATEQEKIKMAEMLGLTKEWVPALDKSAQAFAALQTESTALGLTINRDIIAKATEFDAEWRKASTVFSTWMKAKLADLLPLLDELIGKATELGSGVMAALDSAANSPAGREFTTRSNRASAILEMLSPENDAAENANIVAAAAKAMAGTLSDATAKLLDQQIAVNGLAKFWNDYATSMTAATDATEKFIKKLPTGANDNKVKPSVLPPKAEADEARDAWDRAISTLDRHIGKMQADTLAVGQSIAVQAQLRAEFSLLEAAQVAEKGVTDDQIAQYAILRASMSATQALTAAGIKLDEDDVATLKKKADATLAAAAALEKAKIASDISRGRQMALLSPEDVQIAEKLKNLYGNDIPAALNSSEASAMRMTNTIKGIKDSFQDLTKSVVASMMAGKSFNESMAAGLKNLSARLADKAIEQLLSEDFAKAAVSAVSAAVTWVGSLFFGDEKKQNEIYAQARAANERTQGYVARAQLAAVNQSTLQGALLAFDLKASQDRTQEWKNGNGAIADLDRALAFEREQIITDFNAKAIDDAKVAAEEQLRIQREINSRILSAQDRLFNAMNDPNSLQGQLAAFDRQAQRDREDEVQAGGQALVDLEAAQAAERFNVIKKFNDDIVENSKKAAQDQLDAQTKAARSIVDYISGINVGPESALSPTARLSAAQGTYNSVLTLAQGGNMDALGRITQDAENLRKALKDFYASGSGFQSGWATIQAQLLALPVVSTSTDPIVQAIRDNIVATQNVQVAVQADTTALVTNFNIAINKFSDAVTYLAQTVNALTSGGGWLSSLNNLQLTANQQLATSTAQLQILNSNFGISNTAIGPTESQGILAGSANDSLRKIVYNTAIIAGNTQNSVPKRLGTFEFGGIASPYSSFIFGEHHPRGPFYGTAGSAPISISPLMPSFGGAGNDNSRVEAKLDQLIRVLSAVGAAMVNAETMTGREVRDAVVGAFGELNETIKAEGRHDRGNPQNKKNEAA